MFEPDFSVAASVSSPSRLAALASFDILDTPNEEAFDRIARLISHIFGVEIGIVSMIDGHRQWYKAVKGLPTTEAQLDQTFCRHTLSGDGLLIVTDASRDDRFSDNPHVTGGPRIRFYAGAPLRTRDGQNLGTICAIGDQPRQFGERESGILRDLAGLVMRELELRQMATIDGLTGCLSRFAFKTDAQRQLALAIRHKDAFSVLAFDLDHFKKINDTHGHAAGDAVLHSVAAACREKLRQTDLFGRLGGEEFAIALPHTGMTSALEVAEKLRLSIQAVGDQLGFPVTASFGIAALSGTDDIEALLEKADRAAYSAKEKGRNQIVAAPTPVTPPPPRKRVLKAGKIWFNMQHSTIDCTVKSIGADGAELQVFNAVGVPAEFKLSIPVDQFEANCQLTSHTNNRLQVTFF